MPPGRMIEERRYNPPRPVLVEHDGVLVPGQQYGRLCDDGPSLAC
ncbi:hypothetical protein ACI8AC_23710 [Geodermatophilus sp. SYSU D00758]